MELNIRTYFGYKSVRWGYKFILKLRNFYISHFKEVFASPITLNNPNSYCILLNLEKNVLNISEKARIESAIIDGKPETKAIE